MSLNKPTCLKVKLGDDLRKVQSIPATVESLKDILRTLFGSSDFHLRYVDEESDLVTITTDEELRLAAQSPLGPSLKIVLTPFGCSLKDSIDFTGMSSIFGPRLQSNIGAEFSSIPRKPAESKPKEEVKPVAVPSSKGKPESKPEPKPEPKPEARPEPKKELKPEARPEPKKELKAEAKPEPKTEVKPDAKKEATQLKPETKPEAKAEVKVPQLEEIISKVGKRLLKGCKGNKAVEDTMVINLVQTEVFAALGVPPPAVHPQITCISCRACPIKGVRYQCTVCPNFDFCEVCEATVLHDHPFLKCIKPAVVPAKPEKPRKAPKAPDAPQMKFIRHGNLEDNAQVKPACSIVKEWRVQNTGPAWPAKVHLRKTKGNIAFQFVPVAPIRPGEEGSVRLLLEIPPEETVCKGVFRLCTGEGTIFGDKLRVSLQVVNKRDYSEQLQEIKNMGFPDDENILRLLDTFQGNKEQVVAHLLQ